MADSLTISDKSQITKETAENTKLPAMFRALKHRNYQYFFIGQLLSLIGTWMQSVAQAWLVYRLTGSTVLLGLISFSGQIPVFLLAPVGGAIADKYNRQRILQITQTAAMILASVLTILTLTDSIQVWHIFVLSALLGLANAFDIPTRQAFIVDIVKREDLTNAIALNSSMFNGARIVGPAVAGLLVASVGEGWCFGINAVSYIAVLTGLFLIKIQSQKKVPMPGSAISNIVEGFKFVAKTSPVRSLLLLLGLISLMGSPYAILMPIFADQILHGGASGLGILMGASGVGALAGALALAARKSLRGLGRWIAFASAGFGICIVLFSFSRSFWLSAACLVPAGFAMMIQMAASNTLVQSMVPDNLRGRVMAVYSMMFMGMAPLGAIFAGTVAQNIGAPYTVAIGGTVCVIGAIIFGLNLSEFRTEAREIIIALNMASGSIVDRPTGESAILALQEEEIEEREIAPEAVR
ncbi:MAG TPA: MFS transporter [Pyrinomonadaceae bacterium]|jgi:MFS family permease|nr:MFS transporter [Pyrinomonadaceae bacterium]